MSHSQVMSHYFWLYQNPQKLQLLTKYVSTEADIWILKYLAVGNNYDQKRIAKEKKLHSWNRELIIDDWIRIC